MKGRFLTLTVITMFYFTTGCASYKWVKPGGDDEELQRQQIICQAEALQKLPPELITESETIFSPSDKDCNSRNKHHKKKSCEDDLKTIRFRHKDINQDARNIFVKECLYKNGWQEVLMQDTKP